MRVSVCQHSWQCKCVWRGAGVVCRKEGTARRGCAQQEARSELEEKQVYTMGGRSGEVAKGSAGRAAWSCRKLGGAKWLANQQPSPNLGGTLARQRAPEQSSRASFLGVRDPLWAPFLASCTPNIKSAPGARLLCRQHVVSISVLARLRPREPRLMLRRLSGWPAALKAAPRRRCLRRSPWHACYSAAAVSPSSRERVSVACRSNSHISVEYVFPSFSFCNCSAVASDTRLLKANCLLTVRLSVR